ncbi:MAG: hypothetical protein AB1805_07500 [Nitrospirota bacterium]
MEWIKELTEEELTAALEKDSELVFQHCGLPTLIALWENLPGITIYLSEKPLYALKRRYARKHFDPNDDKRSAKALAILLKVSEKFIYEAISSSDEKDDRQGRLI